MTALMHAAIGGHFNVVWTLWANDNVDIRPDEKESPIELMRAIKEVITVQVKDLIAKYYISSNVRSLWGTILQMLAAQSGFVDVAKVLPENGLEVNEIRQNSQTALKYAAQAGHDKMVESLVENGAQVNVQKHRGMTAFMYAAQNCHIYVVNSLLSNERISVDAENDEGKTALIFVIGNGYTHLGRAILEKWVAIYALRTEPNVLSLM